MQLWSKSETSVAIKSPKVGQQSFSIVVEYFCFKLLMGLLVVLDRKAKSILSARKANRHQH
jgi:hypothetical protein|tara:strand:+ start:787 stop:969 length:183 start_codon:yes stop_codon:yes gene_type:complete